MMIKSLVVGRLFPNESSRMSWNLSVSIYDLLLCEAKKVLVLFIHLYV